MKEKRVSNKLKQKQLETKYLEQQTKKMQDKLGDLKRQIEQQKKLRAQMGLDSTVTRWQKTTKQTSTLKSYAKQVLQEQKQAYAQFGINQKKITGSKAFEGVLKQIKLEKDEEEEKNPTKITTFLKKEEISQVQEDIGKKTVLENNFFKAKMDVKNLIKQKSLQEFLQQNFILEYYPRFQEEEIIDLQSLRYITRQQLQEMGVKAGHQVKIIKKIKEQFDKMLNGKQEEPPATLPQQTFFKIESGYGQGDVNAYSNDLPLDLESKIQQNNAPSQQQEDQQDQYQDQVLITAPMREISLQSQEQIKINCYECYKAITFLDLHYDQKYFCSQLCMNKYLSLLKKSCPNCNKIFLKTQGYREQGIWFCSLGCCPNHQQIQQLFFQWHTTLP